MLWVSLNFSHFDDWIFRNIWNSIFWISFFCSFLTYDNTSNKAGKKLEILLSNKLKVKLNYFKNRTEISLLDISDWLNEFLHGKPEMAKGKYENAVDVSTTVHHHLLKVFQITVIASTK